MNTDKANSWLTLAANLGVLVGIIFLALEIRQSNRIALATTELSVRDSFSTLNETIYSNPDLIDVFVEAEKRNAEFTRQQEHMLHAFIYRLINTWTATEVAFKNGLVPEYTFESTKSDIRDHKRYFPGMTPYFREVVGDFPETDESEIDAIMRQLWLGDET